MRKRAEKSKAKDAAGTVVLVDLKSLRRLIRAAESAAIVLEGAPAFVNTRRAVVRALKPFQVIQSTRDVFVSARG